MGAVQTTLTKTQQSDTSVYERSAANPRMKSERCRSYWKILAGSVITFGEISSSFMPAKVTRNGIMAHPFSTVKHGAHIAERGRAWLADEESARFNMVFGNIKGLDWIDSLEGWQIVAAYYLTPTVGLGCRSGDCMIFVILSFTLLIFEFLLLWLTTRRGWFAFSIHASAVRSWVTNINVLCTVCGIRGR